MEQDDAIEVCHLADPSATAELGRALAARLSSTAGRGGPALLLLRGDLGAGKTSLVQGLAAGLGITEPITSPTFALAQHYRGRQPDGGPTALIHLDLYRLEVSAAADDLFAQEEEEARGLAADGGGVVVLALEWPERLSVQPAGAWRMELAIPAGEDDGGRLATLTVPGGDQGARLQDLSSGIRA